MLRQRWYGLLLSQTSSKCSAGTVSFRLDVDCSLFHGLEKEELIQALGISFTVSTVTLGLALVSKSAFNADMAYSSVLALMLAMIGMFIGQSIRSRPQPDIFRQWMFTGLLLIGLYMLIRSIALSLIVAPSHLINSQMTARHGIAVTFHQAFQTEICSETLSLAGMLGTVISSGC